MISLDARNTSPIKLYFKNNNIIYDTKIMNNKNTLTIFSFLKKKNKVRKNHGSRDFTNINNAMI